MLLQFKEIQILHLEVRDHTLTSLHMHSSHGKQINSPNQTNKFICCTNKMTFYSNSVTDLHKHHKGNITLVSLSVFNPQTENRNFRDLQKNMYRSGWETHPHAENRTDNSFIGLLLPHHHPYPRSWGPSCQGQAESKGGQRIESRPR